MRKRGTFEHARLGHDARAFHPVAADNDRVNVERLRQLESTGPGRLKLLRQTEMVERIHAIGPAHWRKACRGKTRVQNLRRSLANPLKIRLSGSIIERKDQQDAVLARAWPRRRGGLSARIRTPNASASSNVNPGPCTHRSASICEIEERKSTTG